MYLEVLALSAAWSTVLSYGVHESAALGEFENRPWPKECAIWGALAIVIFVMEIVKALNPWLRDIFASITIGETLLLVGVMFLGSFIGMLFHAFETQFSEDARFSENSSEVA